MRRFYLFGHPLTHSISPPIHRQIWAELGVSDCTFENQSTENDAGFAEVGRTLRSSDFAGASVTMPAKAGVLEYVDEVARDCQLVGACNCVYLDETGRRIGTNVDWIGIRHALLSLLDHGGAVAVHSTQAAFDPSRTAGFVLGAGGATRASVYALHTLGAGRIFIVNRDAVETGALVAHFAQAGITVEPIERAVDVPAVITELAAGGRRMSCAAAAIPVLPVTTPAEREVYAIAEALFAVADDQPRYFCDRASASVRSRLTGSVVYGPSPVTPFVKMARAHEWSTVPGWHVTLGQAFAAERLWLRRDSLGPDCEASVTAAMRERFEGQ